MEAWLVAPGATKRLFGVTAANYKVLTKTGKADALKQARASLAMRLDRTIAQRRNDCIHNCDRPKVKPQAIGEDAVHQVLTDVSFFVERCHAHITAEFGAWMRDEVGFSDPQVTGVGY
jgi:hypothetical protein